MCENYQELKYMDKLWIWKCIILYFFTSSLLFSQQVVKWDEILKEAKEKNLQLKQSETSLQQTKLKIEKLKGEVYPRINFSASSGKNYSKNFDSDL